MLLSSVSLYLAVRDAPAASSSKHRLWYLLQPHRQLELGPGTERIAKLRSPHHCRAPAQRKSSLLGRSSGSSHPVAHRWWSKVLGKEQGKHTRVSS